MNEVYKTIWEFPDYEVSNLGNFRKLSGEPVKPYRSGKEAGKGFVVKFRKEEKRFTRTVGRLIAEAFIANPHGYEHIIYKDHNVLNFSIGNLEWASGVDVMWHRVKRRPGLMPKEDSREGQIKKLERNLEIARLFLDFLKKGDTENLNHIVLLFDKEIRTFICKWTCVKEKQEDCYQYVVCSFLENVDRNIMVSANIEAYLRGIVRNYFLRERKKKKYKEIEYNNALMY